MCSNGSHVVTGSWDKTVILWDIQKGEPVNQYEGHTEGRLYEPRHEKKPGLLPR